MQCSACNQSNREERCFCGRCGAALAARCVRCGFANRNDEQFCGGCGVHLDAAAAAPQTTAPAASKATGLPQAKLDELLRIQSRAKNAKVDENLEYSQDDIDRLFKGENG